jgi:hypothetical protein
MHRARASLVAAVSLVLAGCGDGEREPPPRPVQVTVEAPGDATVVRKSSVDVRGTVSPGGADVLVAGEPADVRGRSWSASVELEPGSNVVDVAASADERLAAVEAIRVVREMPVAVPDVKGLTPDEARDELAALGLELALEERRGLLDGLLPGELGVCETSPEAGKAVRPGATVTVTVAKVC